MVELGTVGLGVATGSSVARGSGVGSKTKSDGIVAGGRGGFMMPTGSQPMTVDVVVLVWVDADEGELLDEGGGKYCAHGSGELGWRPSGRGHAPVLG